MIDVENLSKRFLLPSGEEIRAVDDVSFHVDPGEVYALLGPNGAGKTTTIRMILGLLQPSDGTARIGGYSSTRQPDEVKRRVGLVSASTGVYQCLTAREMLLFFADLYGVPPERAKEELDRLGDLLGLSEFLGQPCSTLSTGQRQRLNLARALIHSPPVMLLDEPTLGIDVLGSQVIVEFILHLRDQGKAVILCTHRMDEAERLGDRFGLLHRGKIVTEGTLAQLREQTGRSTLVEMFLTLAQVGPALSTDRSHAFEH